MNEDSNLVMDILAIHNTYAEIDKAENDANERNRQAKIKTQMNTRYLQIAVELEKLKK